MTAPPEPRPEGRSQDGQDEAFAALFDELLQEVLEGREPDLDTLARSRPELRDRIGEAYSLACSVAGRREPARPTLGGYEILRELGRGGMGTVYLARQQLLDRQVAVKVLPHSLGLSARARERFLAEARTLARLRHDHIVRIHRIVDDSEMLAFEMEYVEGPSLQQALDKLRATGPGATLDDLAAVLGCAAADLGARNLPEYFVQLGVRIARALHEVHRGGLIHRDVKPSNILLRPDGRPLLSDFGLARGLELTITRTGAFAGTPVYASPEQLRAGDEALDARSDVYSLAVTLYEAIALTPPFAGRSTADVLRRIESGLVPPLRRRAPHVSRDLETILAKAMERNPKDRYASAAEFADDLERLLSLQPIRARPAGPLRRGAKFVRRHRRTLLAGAAGAAVVGLSLWPWIDHALAAESAARRAARHLRQAHLELISADSRQAWAQTLWGERGRAAGRSPGVSQQVQALRSAQAQFGLALQADPAAARPRLEKAVVDVVLWLRTRAPRTKAQVEAALASDEWQALAAPLPPQTARAARRFAEGGLDAVAGPAPNADLDRAAAEDRLALGLLAFLLGDLSLCEAAWSGLEAGALDYPLLDAGLGVLYAADGRPERAYPHLFHARRAFPESEALAVELAGVALVMGDGRLAEQWLAVHPGDDPEGDGRRQLLAADLLAAKGRTAGAEAAYRKLVERNHADPTPRHRLVELALAAADLERARQLLEDLILDWPEVARFHLDLARIALQERDLAAYLAQARYAVAKDYGRGRSPGTRRDLLEILRLGGLRDLFRRGLEVAELPYSDRRHRELATPVADLAPPVLAGLVEGMVLQLGRYDRARAARIAALPLQAGDATRRLVELSAAAACLPPVLHWLDGRHRLLVLYGLPWLAPELSANANQILLPILLRFGYENVQEFPPLAPSLHGEDDPNLALGSSLAGPGDLDGDGVPDLLVGSGPIDPARSPGLVRALSGRDGSELYRVRHASAKTIFGFALAGAGDLDGDGVGDWICGAPLGVAGSTDGGIAVLYSGRDGRRLRELSGDGPGFGVSVAGLGDLDGDGRPEVAVGTSPALRSTAAAGKVEVYSGASGRLLYELRSDVAGVWFGSAVAAAGDVDGDGRGDLIVGGNHGGAPGLVRVYSGATGAVLQQWEDSSTATEFGRCVGGCGDLDGDGHGDLFVGAPGSPEEGGRVYLFSGRDGRTIATLRGAGSGDGFGFAVAALDDLDGDGRPELAVGAPGGGPARCGVLQVRSGRTGAELGSYFGPHADARFGSAVAVLGDLDGDGLPDFSVAAALGGGQGQVVTVSGATALRIRGR